MSETEQRTVIRFARNMCHTGNVIWLEYEKDEYRDQNKELSEGENTEQSKATKIMGFQETTGSIEETGEMLQRKIWSANRLWKHGSMLNPFCSRKGKAKWWFWFPKTEGNKRIL